MTWIDAVDSNCMHVLLMPYNQPSFEELFLVAEAMQADGRYKPIMVLKECAMEELYRERLSKANVNIIRLHETTNDSKRITKNNNSNEHCISRGKFAAPPQLALRKVAKDVLNVLVNLLKINFVVDISHVKKRLNNFLFQARQVFEEIQPLALLVAEDRAGIDELAFMRVAKDNDCSVVVVPYAYTSDPTDLSIARKNQPLKRLDMAPQRLLKYWIQLKYPHQIHMASYGPILYYTPAKIRSLAAMKMLPPNPWCLGGGISDMVAAHGEEDRQRYIKLGIPSGKIALTGQPSNDSLYKSRCNASKLVAKLTNKYSLDGKKKIIICALPILAEHDILDWSTHWEEIRFLASSLMQTEKNVLLSLHPKTDGSQYQFLKQEFGIHILQEPLQDVLAAADLFVSSTVSTTVRWAVLLNIPVVAVDFYGHNSSIYNHCPGVVQVRDKAKLSAMLQRVLTDRQHYNHLKERQREVAENIAPFDGQANQRIIDLISAHVIY